MGAARYAVLILLIVAAAAQQRGNRQNDRFNYFDIEFLKEIIGKTGIQNFVVSPASTKAILALLLEGADGNTASQIQDVLRLDGDKTVYRTHINNFLKSLQIKYPGSVVEIVNQVFVSPDSKPLNEYQNALKNFYYSGIQTVDFSRSQRAANTINDWVERNTHGLIRNLVHPDGLSPYTRAVVANALFFKAKWTIPFDPKATTVRCFYSPDQTCKKAYFMETLGQHKYADIRNLNAQALELTYQGSKFSMLFLLPNRDVNQLLRDLSYNPLSAIISHLEKTTVYVSVPRFSLEYETDLVEPLKKLGIKDIFEPQANLSKMLENRNGVYISKVLQKAIIEVNEEGTKGAAASGAIAIPLMGPTRPKFRADRPFLFFLRDIETGNFVFEGLVVEPELADDSVPMSFRDQVFTSNAPFGAAPQPDTFPQPGGNIPSESVSGFQISGSRIEETSNAQLSATLNNPQNTNSGNGHGPQFSSQGAVNSNPQSSNTNSDSVHFKN